MLLNQLSTRSTHLPPHWSNSIHPEGKIYFHRDSESGLRVVTESYLYNPNIKEAICAWVTKVEERALMKGFVFTNRTELFLELDGNDCNYYFVDHDIRILFWLDAYDTSELGILPVVSPSHLSKQNSFISDISDILSQKPCWRLSTGLTLKISACTLVAFLSRRSTISLTLSLMLFVVGTLLI